MEDWVCRRSNQCPEAQEESDTTERREEQEEYVDLCLVSYQIPLIY